MAQFILPVAGAAIGFVASGGNPAGAQLGFALGSVGNAVLGVGVQDSVGPRLDDLKAPKVAYGTVIPYVEGHPRLPTIVGWQSDKREIENSQGGGKGGPEQTSFTYVVDLLIVLAENDIGDLRRVWSNGKLVFTQADDSTDESIDASEEAPWSRITLYRGSADQLPDPTYESAVGTANAPAYRDRTTVIITDLDLGGSGQLPVLTFECSGNAEGALGSKAIRLYKELPAGSVSETDVPAGAFVGFSNGTFRYHRRFPPIYSTSDSPEALVGAILEVYQGGPAVEQAESLIQTVEVPSVAGLATIGSGNSDVTCAVFAGNSGVPQVYIASEDGIVSFFLQNQNDYIGNSEIRYSLWADKIIVGSSATIGFGAGAYAGATGATGTLYLYTSSGTYLNKVLIGEPVSSIAMNSSQIAALCDMTVKFYSVADLSFVLDVALPEGTQHRLFTTSQGLIACANAEAQIYTYSGDWQFLVQLVTDAKDPVDNVTPVDLGTENCIHMVDGRYAYAVDIYTQITGGLVPDIYFALSGFEGTAIQEKTLDAAVVGYGVTSIWKGTTAFSGPRPVRNARWSILSTSVPPSTSFLTYIRQYIIRYEWEMLYGFGGDSQTGWFGFGANRVFQEYFYNSNPLAPESFTRYAVYRQDLGRITVSLVEPTLQEVVERQCERAGIPAEYVDASDLATRFVAGMPLTQIVSPRNVIDTLSRAYFFTAVESDVLRFKFLGGPIVATISYDDLGASTADPEFDALPIAYTNDIERPVQVFVKYINGDDDYQDGNEQSFRVTNSPGNSASQEFSLVFTPTEAKRIADVTVQLGKISSVRFGPLALNRDWAYLEPTDPVLLTDKQGNTYRARMSTKDEVDGVLTFGALLDDATVVNSAAQTAGGYNNVVEIDAKLDTEFEPLDIPLLRDVDDITGVYWAAGGLDGWPGASWNQSADDVTFSRVSQTERNNIIGITDGTLGDFNGGRFFDEVNVLRVTLTYGQLASYGRDDVLNNEAGAYLVGSEVIQARNATLVSTGVYDLTGLLRGMRGTEWAIGGHTADERFVVLDAATLNRQSLQVSDILRVIYWKAVTFGRQSSTATSESLTFNAVSKKPFAPVDLRGNRDTEDVVITWERRTRLSTNFYLGSYPLGEVSESYIVSIYADSGYTSLLSEHTVSTNSFTYTAAMQGSPQAAIIYVKVCQVSAIAGRGYTVQGAL